GHGGAGGFGGGGGGRGNQRTATAGVGGFGAGTGGGSTGANGGGGGLGAGGAIFNHQGTLSLLNTTLSGNTAAGGSGGINATSGQGLGGGIFNLNGSVSLSFSTLARNTAANGGGEVFNLSHEAASGITAQAAALTLSNSILALSTGGVDALVNQQRAGAAAATVTATDPNIVDTLSNLGGAVNGSGILTTNPQLGAFADNGGPTQTLALLTGSPAINAGTNAGCPATDQRGFTRPQPSGGACDLGAYEFAPTTTVLAAAPNPAVLAQTVALTATVSPNTATGTVNFQEGGSALTCAEGAQPRPLSGDSATCTVTGGFGVGAHAFTADYTSDNGYAPSQGTTNLEVLATTAQGDGGGGSVTAAITGGACIGFANGSTSFPAPPTPLPPGVTFPYGLFGFTALCPPGGTLTLTMTYPNPLPPGTQYWKYGPTADNNTPHWYVLPATLAGNTATFTITDGGLGDDDLAADGDIVDQGGPGVPSFVDTAAGIPTLHEWALLLLSALFGGLLWQGRRRFG
ncbi:MAG: IPTL-CTERM sorting domain-containing protein, partial [Candidatus Contendobacter sp.]